MSPDAGGVLPSVEGGSLSDSVIELAGVQAFGQGIPRELRAHRATVLLVDVESGAIVDANDSASRFYGWSREELRQRSIFDINSAPRERVQAAIEAFNAGSNSEAVLFRHRMADGSLRDVEVSSSPLEHGGRLLLCSIIHDVTQRSRDQERSVLISQGLQGVLAGADELLGLSLDDLLRRAIELGRERLGLERCSIYLADRDADVMRGTFALSREGHAIDQRGEVYRSVENWLGAAGLSEAGPRWASSRGKLVEHEGDEEVVLREDGWVAITLIRSSQGITGTFHNDCAWSGAPLSPARQELVDVYCSLLGSIIERARVEEALRHSEKSLRLLAENATDLVGRVSTTGQILYLSPSCRAVMGYEPAQLLGQSVFGFVHPQDAAGSKYLRRPNAAGLPPAPPTPLPNDARADGDEGETTRRELRALNAQGEWVWLEVASRLVRAASGNLAEVQFSARDISARRRAEEAQRASEERFRLFMDNTPTMAFIKDEDGRYLYLNQTAQKLYNAPLEQMLGLTNYDRLPRDVAQQLRANDRQVLATGKAHEFLEIIPDPAGRERSWLTFKFPLPNADGAPSIGGVAVDVTERSEFEAALWQSEHRLSTVINSAPLVLWTLDREGTFLASEGQGLQAMGLSPGEVVGRSAFEMYADFPEILSSLHAVLGGEEFNGDLPLGDMVLQCRHRPLFDAQGQLTGCLGVAVDITERRRAEEALAHTVGRLENLLEIDRAIRLARSPSEVADAALSRLCEQLNCGHAAVTVFNFESGEATVLASRDGSARRGGAVACDLGTPPVFTSLVAGAVYPLDEIVAMLAPLVVRDADALAPDDSAASLPGGLLAPAASARLRTEPTAEAAEGKRSPVFWESHGSGSAGSSPDPTSEKRRSLPLIAGGELVGALDVESADAPLPEERWNVAREVAGQLAIAIQQARLFEQVRAGRRQLQALSHRLIEAQEAERRHLARELHDEIGQVLTAVKINLQGVAKLSDRWIERVMLPSNDAASTWGADRAREVAREAAGLRVRLSESVEIVEHALAQVRDLSLNLRPSLLDDLGLGPAIRWFVERMASRVAAQVSLEITMPPERLHSDIETACFRMAQEALTNAVRHSGASHIDVILRQGESALELLIRDDGQGFDVRLARESAEGGSSLGLPGMEERAVLAGGRMSVDSAPGRGTTLHVVFPLHPERTAERIAWPTHWGG